MSVESTYQIVPTEIVGETTERKSLDGSLVLIELFPGQEPYEGYEILTQSYIDENVKFSPAWYSNEIDDG